MKTLLLLSITSICLFASGCQPVRPDQLARERAKMSKVTQGNVVVTNDSIMGTWKGSCVLDSTQNQMYRQDILEIASNFITSTSNYFSDSNCHVALYSQSSSGLYQIGNDSLHGVTAIVVTLSNVSILAETSIIASLFNQKALCKATDWVSGQLRFFGDVTVCGIAATSNSSITRNASNGQNELTLNSESYIKQ